jgi:hypothetical protein
MFPHFHRSALALLNVKNLEPVFVPSKEGGRIFSRADFNEIHVMRRKK